MKRVPTSEKAVARLSNEARRKAARRNKRLTRAQQQDARKWDETIAQEEAGGIRYALLDGGVVIFDSDGGGPGHFMGSDGWFAWMTHHLRRRGRVYKTREEALFVLFGLESRADAEQGTDCNEEPSPS